ncbi:hypothetical protein KIN20_017882 [Parelaphostrongylus tenuis]|uniref:Uncharacterized protein n=1 Tax=Parelaphostrongylus tenuis TaxID=148309 RepID=A0AAD5MM43_PARTN|nr:hypothetical protein KIN20_017882 [Parelaphostrongylus tenuis]
MAAGSFQESDSDDEAEGTSADTTQWVAGRVPWSRLRPILNERLGGVQGKAFSLCLVAVDSYDVFM